MSYPDHSESSYGSIKDNQDKLPHDASVFVGSLPSNIDQGDLTRMLIEHLSEHTQIKNIKVVRDSKGGVCAFVQCEDADSASILIQTLQSSTPKPFLGRILRYEPARAFRSLLISYRKPTQFNRPPGINIMNNVSSKSLNFESELDLPDTMRIWKHRNSSILYNLEAVRATENHEHGTTDQSVVENALFLHPLKFDEESLRSIASYFGKLEEFKPFQPATCNELEKDEGDIAQLTCVYPEPHNGVRSPTMDKLCWQIKWEHRDDCVSALMTLRRVPHLTVTWAHQPPPSGQSRRSTHYQPSGSFSYNYQYQHHKASHSFQSPNSPFKPLPLKDGKHFSNDQQKAAAANCPLGGDLRPCQSLGNGNSTSFRKVAEPGDQDDTRDANQDAALLSWAADSQSLCDRFSKLGAQKVACDNIPNDDCQGGTSLHDDFTECESQEICVPATPCLDSSSITPASAVSGFPVTPLSVATEVRHSTPEADVKESIYPPKTRSDRDIDPTTLFVGGLEMFGPGAWDEEKVRVFFARFGGLESVKLVRPLNSCAAFAFVKFDNAESPARAVYEEHNRIYEGRAMRVQLRDCNPPRHNWKFNRGRARPHLHHFNGQRRVNYYRPPFVPQEKLLPLQSSGDGQGILQGVGIGNGEERHLEVTPKTDLSAEQMPPSESLSGAKDSSPTETYREWYDTTESSTCSPEPSLRSSASAAGPMSNSSFSFSAPNGAYYPPLQWMNPYPPPGPYQLPYYPGYAAYPPGMPPQPQSSLPSPPGSEIGGPTGNLQHGWPPMGMYTSFIPYAAIPPRAHLVEQGQIPPPLNTQAPVVPAGFIQNEQGTLIAVYQPEVLDRYLAGSETRSTPIPTPHPVNLHRWECPPAQQIQETGNVTANTGIPSHNRMIHPFPSSPSRAFPLPSSSSGLDTVTNSTPPPLYRRQVAGRREVHPGYNPVRPQSHPRAFVSGRAALAPMHHPQIHLTDLGHHTPQPVISADWNRRSVAR
ncbi:hypothetical protein CPC08DRAFT_814999 [Agrocybe pediades]|nr:hypothetical protein CPC08DRAFT_814999 [Agrocybe pediades]